GRKKVFFDSVQLKHPTDTPYPHLQPTDDVLLDDEKRWFLEQLEKLKSIAIELGLQVHLSDAAPLNFVETDNIPKDVIEEHSRKIFVGKDIWIFSDPSVLDEIKQTLEGKIRLGDLLGYPKCCVDFMACIRTRFLEECYEHFLAHHKDGYDRQELMDYLRKNAESYPGAEKIHIRIKQHVFMTNEEYPFVYHQACGACLDRGNSPTFTLNLEYSQFAKEMPGNFDISLLKESRRFVSMLAKKYGIVQD
ncbi:MAG: hypothetical protein ACREBU_22645, partial [Nitrososphaera sp.]